MHLEPSLSLEYQLVNFTNSNEPYTNSHNIPVFTSIIFIKHESNKSYHHR